MTDDQRDHVRAALLIGGALLAGIAVNAISIVGKTRADVGDQHDIAPSLTERTVFGYARAVIRKSTASTSCLPSSIRAALDRANAACGIRVISTHRPGARIAGTGHVSMHASCRAADFTTGSPGCVLRTLADWPGKLSTDYGRVRHFHIDDSRYARFAHAGSRRFAKKGKRTRYARAKHRREATAQ